MACNGCDLNDQCRRPLRPPGSPAIADFSPQSQEAHIDIDPSSINKGSTADFRNHGATSPMVLEEICASFDPRAGRKTNQPALIAGGADRRWRAGQVPALSK